MGWLNRDPDPVFIAGDASSAADIVALCFLDFAKLIEILISDE
jgi:hypothetical protein